MSRAMQAPPQPTTAVPGGMWFEDFVVGQCFDSPVRLVDDADVHTFAQVSGDTHPLHIDPEYAATTRFGRPVVHGPFGIAAFFGLFHELDLVPESIVALLDTDWRYLRPLFAGDSIRFRMTITRCRRTRGGDQGEVNRHVALLNQSDEMVQEGSTAMLVRARDPLGRDPIGRAFGTVGWAAELVRRLEADEHFAAAVGGWDGTVGLRVGRSEVQLRIYRGRVLEAVPRTPLGATFTVEAPELVWTELLTGPANDFTRRAMGGAFQVHGNGYDYLRLTKALVVLTDVARALAGEVTTGE